MASKVPSNLKLKNVSVSYESSDDDEDNKTDVGLEISLEKLNLGLEDCKRLVGRKKKLLVLALGGLLAYRVHQCDEYSWIPAKTAPDLVSKNFLGNIAIQYRQNFCCFDIKTYLRHLAIEFLSVFKRPFCDEFLKFCFERFEVAIWSSARKHNKEDVMNLVFGELKSKLLFVWGQEECTDSGYESLEKKNKTIFLKDFRKVLESNRPNCPLHTREYFLLNTLLIDDQPYKALLYPPNTAIFPFQSQIDDINDPFLGAGGELRYFLEGISVAKDVPTYVEEHPYGRPAISPVHPDWHYYSKILDQFADHQLKWP